MRSIWVRVGIIAVVVIGFVVLRPFLTGNAGTLSVGDCFDPPTTVAETVSDVQHHPCTDSHGAEVMFVGTYAPATDVYPTNDEFGVFFDATCTPAFNSYTALDFKTDATYDMSAFTPTADGWSKGDRKVICYAVRLDAGKMTQSIKKA
jgi:hypothetical protein